jgi:glycosyltransferase involved in cell wall biosynthesis
MRIAQIAPLAESVPPKLYGGTERVVAWLIEELIAMGHDVTLFASGDSGTSAKLVPVWPRAIRLGRPRADPVVAQTAQLEQVARLASEFDVIHCHIDWAPWPLLSRLGTPFLNTCHGRLDLPGLPTLVQRFLEAPLVSISDNQPSRSAKPTGWAPSTIASPPTHCDPPSSRAHTWHFSAGLPARKARRRRSG